jgi:hypothetical protein
MKIYLLYYDTDTGSREEWNTFYTPCEAFATPQQRAERIEFIKSQRNAQGKLLQDILQFDTADLDLLTDPAHDFDTSNYRDFS